MDTSDAIAGIFVWYGRVWDKLYEWEDNLPQHDLNLPSPEGSEGRYVSFSNQAQMLGWNNLVGDV